MTADPWDLPTLTHEPLLTMEEYEAIQADLHDSVWDDPTRYQECLQVAMDALRTIACVTVSTPPEVTATQALRRIVQRAVSGVPFAEPCEPADSLDPDPRRPPRRAVEEWRADVDAEVQAAIDSVGSGGA